MLILVIVLSVMTVPVAPTASAAVRERKRILHERPEPTQFLHTYIPRPEEGRDKVGSRALAALSSGRRLLGSGNSKNLGADYICTFAERSFIALGFLAC